MTTTPEREGIAHMPWHAEDFGGPVYLDGVQANYVIRAGGDIAAYAFEQECADLIAAAPQLLEALKRLTGGTTDLADALDAAKQARAAIAAATGRSQG